MDDGILSGVVMVFRDVTKERHTQREIEYLSQHDAMTGLSNRYSLEKTIADLEASQQVTSVIMIEIPLPCRIISVVDAFDAMTHNRVYRLAMSKKEALAEISRNKGKQFDPTIAQIFIDLIESEERKETDHAIL